MNLGWSSLPLLSQPSAFTWRLSELKPEVRAALKLAVEAPAIFRARTTLTRRTRNEGMMVAG